MRNRKVTIENSERTIYVAELNIGDVILYGGCLGIVLEVDKSNVITLEYGSRTMFESPHNKTPLQYLTHSKVFTSYFKDVTEYYGALGASVLRGKIAKDIVNDIEYIIKVYRLEKYLSIL